MCLSTEPPVWTFERESTDSNPVLTLNRVNWATSVKICNRVDMTWTHVRGATDCTELRLSRCTINLYNLSIITLHGSNGFRRPLKLGRPSCTNSTFRIVDEIDIVNCAKLWCIQRYIDTWTLWSWKISLFFVFVCVFVIVNLCQEAVNIINFPQKYKRLGFWP